MCLWDHSKKCREPLTLNLQRPETENIISSPTLRFRRTNRDRCIMSLPFLATVLFYPGHYFSFPTWNNCFIQEYLQARVKTNYLEVRELLGLFSILGNNSKLSAVCTRFNFILVLLFLTSSFTVPNSGSRALKWYL